MTPLEVKHAIERAGFTQAKIGRKLDPPVTPQAVNRIIHAGAISARVHEAIACAINRPVEEIWPEYYLRKASNG